MRRVAEAFRATFATSDSTPATARVARVIASPARRAVETATIVRDLCFPSLELELDEELAPGADPPYALAKQLLVAPRPTLLVGHQPWVEDLVRALVVDASELRGYATATIATLIASERGINLHRVLTATSIAPSR